MFGLQHSDDELDPASTVRIPRAHVKTLRDFIADRAVDDILDSIDGERNELDDVLEETTDYPVVLRSSIDAIERALPIHNSADVFADLERQEHTAAEMAKHLESLAQHYDQMVAALEDSQHGEVFEQDDLAEMNRDTEELPSIIGDLELCLIQLQDLQYASFTYYLTSIDLGK